VWLKWQSTWLARGREQKERGKWVGPPRPGVGGGGVSGKEENHCFYQPRSIQSNPSPRRKCLDHGVLWATARRGTGLLGLLSVVPLLPTVQTQPSLSRTEGFPVTQSPFFLFSMLHKDALRKSRERKVRHHCPVASRAPRER
jgi:hypothetical protein